MGLQTERVRLEHRWDERPGADLLALQGQVGAASFERVPDSTNRLAKIMHPYRSLPPRNFWSSAVAGVNALAISDLYRKKFDISKRDVIATAGSCFAQHIAARLSTAGFGFRDFEPAMPDFPADRRKDYNYGVYSARYCNIYTARQLLQTFQRAFGELTPCEEFWISDKGVQDPFRPLVEPSPFASVEEARASREAHFSALRRLASETDIFIFTFGLTEAWRDRRDGAILPLCPGTQGGVFDPDIHEFVNFTASETISDMQAFISLMRRYKPDMRFVLTVSPVPLVASASENHVLVATTYSKSVLRAAAGELTLDPGIDYFPSYEIVASPPFRGGFFEPDQRSVTPWGVDYVMSHFFRQYQPDAVAPTEAGQQPRRALSRDELICEEIVLDTFAK